MNYWTLPFAMSSRHLLCQFSKKKRYNVKSNTVNTKKKKKKNDRVNKWATTTNYWFSRSLVFPSAYLTLEYLFFELKEMKPEEYSTRAEMAAKIRDKPRKAPPMLQRRRKVSPKRILILCTCFLDKRSTDLSNQKIGYMPVLIPM